MQYVVGNPDEGPQPIGVIVVTHNSVEHLPALLDSLPDAWGNLAAQVVIVDNGSTDNTVAVAQARSDCCVIEAVNGGYSSGINIGIRATPDASAWLVLNPDVRLEPQAVAALAEGLRRPGVGLAGPKVLSPSGALQPSMRREPSITRAMGLSFTGLPTFSEYVSSVHNYEVDGPADWMLGAALMISRACYAAVGPWDESYFLYSEETDYCLRARDTGFLTWYVASAVAIHVGGGSGQTDRTHTMQILNRIRLYRRRHGVLPGTIYYLLTIAGEVSWLVRGGIKSRASLRALVRPSSRPSELGCADHLIPR
jgi:GT2 family glycosyltransferase